LSAARLGFGRRRGPYPQADTVGRGCAHHRRPERRAHRRTARQRELRAAARPDRSASRSGDDGRERARFDDGGTAGAWVRPTLDVVQTAVKHQGSGWEHAIDELKRYYERVAARVGRPDELGLSDPGDQEPPPFFSALEHWYLVGAATLGKRTAELHLTLSEGSGPNFAREPLAGAALEELANLMRAKAEASLQLLEQRRSSFDESIRSQSEALLENRSALLARLDDIRTLDYAGWRIRIHGDYHLG